MSRTKQQTMEEKAVDALPPSTSNADNGEMGEVAATSKPPKSTESKEARFRRLATKRLGKAVKAVNSLTKLSNRNQYAYTVEQIATVMDVLNKAVSRVDTAFAGILETNEGFDL